MNKQLKVSVFLRNICFWAGLLFIMSIILTKITPRSNIRPLGEILIFFGLLAAKVGLLAMLFQFIHFLKTVFFNECSDKITFKIFINTIPSILMIALAFMIFGMQMPV